MFDDIPISDLLFCTLGVVIAGAYYVHQLYGPRCRIAALNMLMRITSSKAFVFLWAIWLLIRPTASFIARKIFQIIPRARPSFFSPVHSTFISGQPTTPNHTERSDHSMLELSNVTSKTAPHSNATLQQWIDEDLATDSEKRRLAKAAQQAEQEAIDPRALLLWRLSRANTLTSSPATPLIDSLLDASWNTDASPLASNTAVAELRLSLRKAGFTLSTSPDREVTAQLPEWLRHGPISDKCVFGRLEGGGYVVQVPGFPQALHLDVERKMYSALSGNSSKELEEKLQMERAWEELGRCGTSA